MSTYVPLPYAAKILHSYECAGLFALGGFLLYLIPTTSAFGSAAMAAGAVCVLRATYWLGRATEAAHENSLLWNPLDRDDDD